MNNLVEQWKKRCMQIRLQEQRQNSVKSSNDIQTVDLYNIVKRSTNGRLNKVVGIGFTFGEAEQWIERKVNRAKEKDHAIVFYDIVAQGNKAALDPLWNPRPFYQEVLL